MPIFKTVTPQMRRMANFADVIMTPDSVIASPKNLASTVFPSVSKVVVRGGKYWYSTIGHANMYDWPTTVTVYLKDGTKRDFTGLQSLTVKNGVRSTTMLGALSRSYAHGLDILGAEAAMVYTLLRDSTVYADSKTTTGSVWKSGKKIFGTDDVQNGRRRVQANVGGTDYWIAAADVAPVVEVSKKLVTTDRTSLNEGAPWPLSSSWVDSGKSSTAATAGPVYTVERIEQAKAVLESPSASADAKKFAAQIVATEKPAKSLSYLPIALVGAVGVLGLGATIALLVKAKWGWAVLAFLGTPVAAGVAAAATGLGKEQV
jgi:hypothetical protein